MRKIPSMDSLLALSWVEGFEAQIGREAVKDIISGLLSELRQKIRECPDTAFDFDSISRAAMLAVSEKAEFSLHKVVNATGVVIHTNLGRSLLADEAMDAVLNIASNYNTLEYSTQKGTRGERNDHVEWLICRLTGAEAAIVVNNNAGAVILALKALSDDKEAVISRGELVEIGGSFRIPDIMELSGAKMVEVGTTNMTHIKDYVSAITEETAMLLKIHPSNYRITGFTSTVSRAELAELAHSRGIILMEDLGSGMLVDTSCIGLTGDPTVRECAEEGADIVTFSGDKLLGGPQAGIIIGKAEIIDKLRKHPLLRALRVDKMTLAALEATLRIYLRGDILSIPTVSMVFKSQEELRKNAQNFYRRLKAFFETTRLRSVSLKVVPTNDTVGGGTYPQSQLPGYGVSLRLPELGSSGKLAEKLRGVSTSVIAGAANDAVLFHMRTLSGEDEKDIIAAFNEILSVGGN
ncbi:MAG: L-seryl-tRNA(Sec) selenium transferase [Synergistaceae bacterium]|nr:L-seryl-tRNA(Sec) selenium transferase [Synergistaceae bacterium]